MPNTLEMTDPREQRFVIDVRPTTLGIPAEASGFVGQLAARRAFWAAVASTQRRDPPAPDQGEERILRELGKRLEQKHPELKPVSVKIAGYGSLELLVTCLGADPTGVLGGWILACLNELFPGAEFLLVPPDTDRKKKRPTVAALAERLGHALPQSPQALLFVALFVLGLFLIEKSWTSVDHLIETRTALIDKLGATEKNDVKAAPGKSKHKAQAPAQQR